MVLLGIDGTGKSTQANLLCGQFKNKISKVKVLYAGNTGLKLGKSYSFYLSMPVDIIINRLLKQNAIIRKKFSFLTKNLLFLNYVFLVLPKIKFFNKLGYVLIIDRYVYDYILFTIFARTYSSFLSKVMIAVTPIPSLVLLLDMHPLLTHRRKFDEKSKV
jgi:thymidylate kinase